jgi:type I restriction enzyme S subunit
VLKYAFEGKLTNSWRSAHAGEIEHPSTLFDEIDQLQKSNQKVQVVCDADLDELPDSWLWVKLGSIAKVMDVDHKMPKSVSKGLLFISPKDFVHPDGIDFEQAKQISGEDFERLSRKCKPQFGDIIYSRIGARLGRARKVPKGIEFQVSYSLCLLRPRISLQQTDFFYWLMKSPFIYKQALAKVRSIGVPDLGLGDIRNFLIPFPSEKEQSVISELVERYLSLADRLRRVTEYNMKEIERFKQAVLNTAFKGKLVRQEASDEAAGLLLERLKEVRPKKRYDEKAIRNVTLKQKDLTDYVE